MSYNEPTLPVKKSDVDYKELDEKLMVAELNRRITAREKGMCDYCGKDCTGEGVVTCTHPLRHNYKIMTLKHTKSLVGVIYAVVLICVLFISGCSSNCRNNSTQNCTDCNNAPVLYGPSWKAAPHCHNGVCE